MLCPQHLSADAVQRPDAGTSSWSNRLRRSFSATMNARLPCAKICAELTCVHALWNCHNLWLYNAHLVLTCRVVWAVGNT